MALCRRVHHSHTLRSSVLAAPISKPGNFHVWTFVSIQGALYSEKKTVRVARALSPMMPAIFGATSCWRCTVILRLTKIIRSGITLVSRNVISRYVIRRLTSRYLEREQPSRVGGSPLCDVVSSFLCHTHIDGQTEKISSWNGPTVHVCCFMLARASTKTFVSRVRKTAENIFVSRKIP